MTVAASATTALLFGGMVLSSFSSAAVLLTPLPATVTEPTIRRAFAHFYLYGISTAVVAALLI